MAWKALFHENHSGRRASALQRRTGPHMQVSITIFNSLNAATLKLIPFPINFRLKKNLNCTQSSGTADHPPTVAYTMCAAARANKRERSSKYSTIRRRILAMLAFSHRLGDRRGRDSYDPSPLRRRCQIAQVIPAFLFLSSGNRGLRPTDFNTVLVIFQCVTLSWGFPQIVQPGWNQSRLHEFSQI
jgi:hypothetical protein